MVKDRDGGIIASCGPSGGGGRSACSAVQPGSITTKARSKSFLVLFFKKEQNLFGKTKRMGRPSGVPAAWGGIIGMS
jgi:hypothetical protein